MAARLEIVVVGAEGAGARTTRVRLTVDPGADQGGAPVALTDPCATIEELERAASAVKDRVDSLVQEARPLFLREAVPQTPEAVWNAMEREGGGEGMRRLFNGLDEALRREVANFVLTHANIFKGAGADFAQGYNEDSALLE
jgi:hypothetical protein